MRLVCCFLLCLGLSAGALALTAEQAGRLAAGESDERIAALDEVVAAVDPALGPLLQALLADEVKVAAGRAFIVRDGRAVDAATGAAATLPADAEDVVNNNRVRHAFEAALAALRLFSPDAGVRAKAIDELRDGADEGKLGVIEKAITGEKDAGLKARLELLKAAVMISSSDKVKRLAAARLLADSEQPATRSLLIEKFASELDSEVKAAIGASLDRVQSRLAWGERLGVLFSGLSLGSILLLVALGLAITYGLMGVINMAHGELMMIGAYATYLVQNAFKAWWPGAFDAYVVVAIPLSFLAAAAVGALMERTVIRWLYGRPL